MVRVGLGSEGDSGRERANISDGGSGGDDDVEALAHADSLGEDGLGDEEAAGHHDVLDGKESGGPREEGLADKI